MLLIFDLCKLSKMVCFVNKDELLYMIISYPFDFIEEQNLLASSKRDEPLYKVPTKSKIQSFFDIEKNYIEW